MIASTLVALLLATAHAPESPVPGQCTAPAAEHVGEPGCYLAAEIDLAAAPGKVFWHLHAFDDRATAEAEAARHAHAVVTVAHGRAWLHVLGARDAQIVGERASVVGPLAVPPGGRARILESWFPPGMITRAHAHPGAEVFYVVEGEQCVETPRGGHRIAAGEHFVVEDGPHLQAAPNGRRSLVLLLTPASAPWMRLTPEWTPTGFCTR